MRVLIVEDEFLIARDICDVLARAGCEVVGMVGSSDEAIALLEDRGCDVAVLDANLKGASAEPVAKWLRARGVPFLVLSGYVGTQLEGELARAPFMAKPFVAAELVSAVRSLRDARSRPLRGGRD
jgi:DNA-binding response OmpR family regulator